ncbi:hypothetical protein L7F22_041436 [Adiantum nelumboides]|nr:hypothetical protein [Adiantum nelumboides]
MHSLNALFLSEHITSSHKLLSKYSYRHWHHDPPSGGTIARPIPMYGTLPAPPPWPIPGSTCPSSDDDCEEFVPLSQEVNLMKTFSLPRAMDFMRDGGSIEPPPPQPAKVVKVMIESQDVDMTTGVEQPSATNIERPIRSTGQEQPSSNVSQKASKRPRQTSVTWDDDTTRALIRIYDEQWNRINKGNFRFKEWEAVVLNLNVKMDTTYNTENAKNRIDTLKKMYKKEKQKSSTTGASPSTWSFFDILDVIWCKTPRCTGLVGGLDSDGPIKENEDILNDLELEVETNFGVSANISQNHISSMDFTELEGVSGSKAKQSKRSLLGVVNRTMEERLLRIREEEDTKRQQIYLSTQLELAKILAKVKDLQQKSSWILKHSKVLIA